jgi:hypothetical protein
MVPASFPVAYSSGRSSSSGGSHRGVLAAILVAVLAVGGFVGYRALSSPSAPAAQVAAPPLSKPLAARAAGVILDRFKPPNDTPFNGVNSKLIPKGNTLVTPTLTGWCALKSRTDRTRIARRQWVFTRAGKNFSDSVEVAAYGTSAQAKAAFDEFVATTAACTSKVVHAAKGTVTYTRVSAVSDVSGDGIRSENATLREDAVVAGTKKNLHVWTGGWVQQRGQFLVILWSGQQRPYNESDMNVLRTIVDDESRLLSATPQT